MQLDSRKSLFRNILQGVRQVRVPRMDRAGQSDVFRPLRRRPCVDAAAVGRAGRDRQRERIIDLRFTHGSKQPGPAPVSVMADSPLDGGECFADDFSRVIMSMKIDDHLIKKAEPALKQIPLSDSRGFYRRGWRSIGAFASVWSHSTFGK